MNYKQTLECLHLILSQEVRGRSTTMQQNELNQDGGDSQPGFVVRFLALAPVSGCMNYIVFVVEPSFISLNYCTVPMEITLK